MSDHAIELQVEPAGALAAVKEAAELWGAGWEPGVAGGRLALPVVRGVRRGVLRGRLSVRGEGRRGETGRTTLAFEIEEEHQRVNRPAVVVLALGGIGGLLVTLWPFHPPLLAFAPVAVVFAFAAWLLVASRLRTSGPDDFLRLVGELAGEPPGGNGDREAPGGRRAQR